MAFQCAPRLQPDAIVRKAFEEFGGAAGFMSKTEFVEFCELGRSVYGESAEKIFASVVKRPDHGISFKEFEGCLNVLLGLGKSNSGTSVDNGNTYTEANKHDSQAVVRENSGTRRTTKQVLAPRGSSESRPIQRSPHEEVLDEASQAPQGRFVQDSKSLLTMNSTSLTNTQHSASIASTNDPESDCSEASCVGYTRCVAPVSKRCITPGPSTDLFAKQPLATRPDDRIKALIAFKQKYSLKQQCSSSASTQDPGSDCSECSFPTYSRCVTPEPEPRLFASQCQKTRQGLVYFDYFKQ